MPAGSLQVDNAPLLLCSPHLRRVDVDALQSWKAPDMACAARSDDCEKPVLGPLLDLPIWNGPSRSTSAKRSAWPAAPSPRVPAGGRWRSICKAVDSTGDKVLEFECAVLVLAD